MYEKKVGVAKLLGTRLRQWRKDSGYKIAELAEIIDISQGSLSDLENNKSLPSADTIAKLHRLTDINIFWLLFNNGPMQKSMKDLEGELSSINGIQEYIQKDALDQHLKELLESIIRIYHHGKPEKLAYLKGFISGADPE